MYAVHSPGDFIPNPSIDGCLHKVKRRVFLKNLFTNLLKYAYTKNMKYLIKRHILILATVSVLILVSCIYLYRVETSKTCDSGLLIGACGFVSHLLILNLLFFIFNFIILSSFSIYRISKKNIKKIPGIIDIYLYNFIGSIFLLIPELLIYLPIFGNR